MTLPHINYYYYYYYYYQPDYQPRLVEQSSYKPAGTSGESNPVGNEIQEVKRK